MVCVAVPTDDGFTVKLGHFGDGRFYLHLAYEDGRWLLKGCVENPYAGEHEHGAGGERGKRPRILELNRGCDVVVAVAFGPGGEEFMKQHGLQVVKVKPRTTVAEAVRIVEEVLGLRE